MICDHNAFTPSRQCQGRKLLNLVYARALSCASDALADRQLRANNQSRDRPLGNALSNGRATARETSDKHQNGNPGALGYRFGFYNQRRAGARQPLRGEYGVS